MGRYSQIGIKETAYRLHSGIALLQQSMLQKHQQTNRAFYDKTRIPYSIGMRTFAYTLLRPPYKKKQY